jgi:peptidoglycan/xylan/chitin deacetylase (PgdA/CDA1 family)
MKVVMYHYVRPSTSLDHFAYLHVADFKNQLNWFVSRWGFVRRDQFCAWLEGGEVPKGVLLTFDDGLLDHVEFVLPVLQERELFALFYVPTAPVEAGVLLDVHKVHLALGRLGGPAAWAWIEAHAPAIWSGTTCGDIVSYAEQRSDRATKQVKTLFNWVLGPEERQELLDGLLNHAFRGSPPKVEEVYCGISGVRDLADCGMGVGPHGHNHLVLSQLSIETQVREIGTSCRTIEALGGSRKWGFCYPYGMPKAFNKYSERAVEDAGCPFAFAVENQDIQGALQKIRRFALPRHNCNSFPHGAVTFGPTRERGLVK